MKKFLLLTALLVCGGFANSVSALDSGPVKQGASKAASWLIEQFKLKSATYGEAPNAAAPEQLAMVIKGLCEAPRDYKEASGPFITEPLKLMLSKMNADGSLKDSSMTEGEALQWVLSALKSTGNAKYADTIQLLRSRAKQAPKPQLPEFDPAQLAPATADAANMRLALFAAHSLGEQNQKEIMLDGKTLKWAEVQGTALLKMQKPNGSFGDDVQTTALALYALELCFNSLK